MSPAFSQSWSSAGSFQRGPFASDALTSTAARRSMTLRTPEGSLQTSHIRWHETAGAGASASASLYAAFKYVRMCVRRQHASVANLQTAVRLCIAAAHSVS